MESDYVPEPELTVFDSPKNSILLGRYGPFRRMDRKPETLYLLKNFIFQNEPGGTFLQAAAQWAIHATVFLSQLTFNRCRDVLLEWAFAVEEKIHGELQIIDITDDVTGSPHELAKRNVAMYVNEIGHNKNLKQNVFIGEDYDRTVLYCIHLDSPLRKDEPVELLTNYRSVYEQVRERKGYGLKNMSWGLRCDQDRASRFLRNWEDRIHCGERLKNLFLTRPLTWKKKAHPPSQFMDLRLMIKFVHDAIWRPNFEAATEFLSSFHQIRSSRDSSHSPLSCQQWVALRRVQWLSALFAERLDTYEQRLKMDEHAINNNLAFPYSSILSELRCMLHNMMKSDVLIQIMKLGHVVTDTFGSSIYNAIREEIAEELCFQCRDHLPMPFDQAVWCPVALDLLDKLCTLTVPFALANTAGERDKIRRTLQGYFLMAAKHAAIEIFKCSDSLEIAKGRLDFKGGLRSSRRVLLSSLESIYDIAKRHQSFYLGNSTFPKCLLAAFVDELAYVDSLQVGGIEPQDSRSGRPIEHGADFIMVNFGGFGTDLETEFRALHCVPRPRSHLEKSSPTTLNITWYLVWQVVFPVYWFAQTLVADDFSLEQLCKVVKVDLKKLAEFAVQRGIESVGELELKRYLRPNVSSANRRRRTASVGPSRLTKALKETSKGTKKRSTVYSDKCPPVATIPEPAHPTELPHFPSSDPPISFPMICV